jgi:hypothetical protein
MFVIILNKLLILNISKDLLTKVSKFWFNISLLLPSGLTIFNI